MNEEQKNSYGFSFSLIFYFENIFEKNKLRKKRKKNNYENYKLARKKKTYIKIPYEYFSSMTL